MSIREFIKQMSIKDASILLKIINQKFPIVINIALKIDEEGERENFRTDIKNCEIKDGKTIEVFLDEKQDNPEVFFVLNENFEN